MTDEELYDAAMAEGGENVLFSEVLRYPISEYSIDWTPTGGLSVPTEDLPAPTSDELSWQTSDSLVVD